MNRIILTKTIVLTEFVFHLKNLSAVCTDDTHKNGRLFGGGSIYMYYLFTIVVLYIVTQINHGKPGPLHEDMLAPSLNIGKHHGV